VLVSYFSLTSNLTKEAACPYETSVVFQRNIQKMELFITAAVRISSYTKLLALVLCNEVPCLYHFYVYLKLWRQTSPSSTCREGITILDIIHRPVLVRVRVRVTLQLTVSQSVRLGVEPDLGLLTRDNFFFFFIFESYCLVIWGRPL
jgi:hypothetical protein